MFEFLIIAGRTNTDYANLKAQQSLKYLPAGNVEEASYLLSSRHVCPRIPSIICIRWSSMTELGKVPRHPNDKNCLFICTPPSLQSRRITENKKAALIEAY